MNGRLVYSTERGRICRKCEKPTAECICKKKKPSKTKKIKPGCPDDGTVRISREVKGRKGKTATIIIGLPLDDKGLKQFAKKLKQQCGSGGSVKDGAIIIQGDHRKTILDEIKKKGYRAKIAGG
jgi:translation initiation factor 1